MSGIEKLFRHDLEVVWTVANAALDAEGEDLGHPATAETIAGTFRGLVQPRSARERASSTGRDINVGDFRIYLEGAALDVVDADVVIRKVAGLDADLDGDYRILFVGNAAGQGHHVELDGDRLT